MAANKLGISVSKIISINKVQLSKIGFWDVTSKLAKGAMDIVEKTNMETNALVEDYRSKDDDSLKRKFKSGSMVEKFAASKVLKERGYGSQS